MNGIPSGVLCVLWIVLTAFCWVTYHKVFDVVYFNLSKGLLKEFLVCGFIAIILLTIVCYFWWAAALIIAVIGFTAFKKGKAGVAVLCGMLVVAVAIIGIVFT